MPALRHCTQYAGHKMRLATLPIGGSTLARSRAEANGLYHAARAMGFPLSVATVCPGTLRVTLLPKKKEAA